MVWFFFKSAVTNKLKLSTNINIKKRAVELNIFLFIESNSD